MNTKKAVWSGLGLGTLLVFLLGFLLPWLFSAADTTLVLSGMGILILLGGYFLTIFVNAVKGNK